MGQKIMLLTSLVASLLGLFSCCYPKPSLKIETASDGAKEVKITYPTPKGSIHNTAFKDGKWAIIFGINDYKQISFPPPGAITDNKWFYYFCLLGKNLLPLVEEPILFEKFDRGEQSLGYIFSIYATETGFVAVYVVYRDFYYQKFNMDGKSIGDKHKFYSTEKTPGSRDRVLATSYKDGDIYLVLLQKPEDFYSGKWGIHLVRHNIKENKTKTFKNIFPNEAGWYHAKGMDVHFSGQSMLATWIDGKELRGKPEDTTYKLSASLHFAHCSTQDMKCKLSTIDKKTKDYYSPELRFIVHDKKTSIVLHEDESTWKQDIGPDGTLTGQVEKLSNKEKEKLLPHHYAKKHFPYKINIGK
ncbi:MAG: hypothetical protein JRF33_18445 [Deltaproteobacteria bacterium]|nr:hypothetical protein [Deltaproteobacteria bacterium]